MSSNALLVGAVLALAGCPSAESTGECLVDSECASRDVCARDHQCASASDVREVTVTWSIDGQAANATTCAGRTFEVEFYSDRSPEPLGFAPVPCDLGQFFIDKLPRSYSQVAVGGIEVSIAANGTAVLDL